MISSNLLFSSSEALELADQLREDLPILGEIDSPVAHNSTCEQPPAPGYLKLIYEFLVKFFQPANTSDGLTNLTESQRFDFELYDFDDPVPVPSPPPAMAEDFTEKNKIKQVDILPGKDVIHRFKSTYNGPVGDYNSRDAVLQVSTTHLFNLRFLNLISVPYQITSG